MPDIRVKKLHPNASLPIQANHGDAGYDLVATSCFTTGEVITYGTGLAIEIPEGYVGLVYPRSSIYKLQLQLCNSVGVIDSGYRGEILVKFRHIPRFYGDVSEVYSIGDRVAQLVIQKLPEINFVESENLSYTSRGESGFGSSGRHS